MQLLRYLILILFLAGWVVGCGTPEANKKADLYLPPMEYSTPK